MVIYIPLRPSNSILTWVIKKIKLIIGSSCRDIFISLTLTALLFSFSGLNCEFKPCEASNPCENGAVCIEEMNLDVFPLGFHCQCVKGFAGPRCEINVNECSSNPCLHGYCYDSEFSLVTHFNVEQSFS